MLTYQNEGQKATHQHIM